MIVDTGDCQAYGRQYTSENDPDNEAQGHEVKRFACVGFECVSDHVRVDENAVFEHEVVGCAGDDQQQDQDRFCNVRYQNEIEQQIECRKNDDWYADAEQEGCVIRYVQMPDDVAPQSEVQNGGEIQGADDSQPPAVELETVFRQFAGEVSCHK